MYKIYLAFFAYLSRCSVSDRQAELPFCDSYAKQCPSTLAHMERLFNWMLSRNGSQPTQLLAPDNVALRYLTEGHLCNGALLHGDRDCPTEITTSGHEVYLSDRSICPWYWKMNYDPLRIPAILPQAACACDRALLPKTLSFECEHVTYNLRVLRFDATCTRYRYDIEKISVACMPVREASHKMITGPLVETMLAPYYY